MVTIDDITSTTLRNRRTRLAESVMGNTLTAMLFGDSIPWKDRPLSYRLRWHLNVVGGRIRDAWLVLIGREHIGGDF